MSIEIPTHQGVLLDDDLEISFSELCATCHVHAELVIQLVEVGALEPFGKEQAQWRFSGTAIRRLMRALKLQQDLDINLAGAALALELLDEIDRLHDRLRVLENL